MNFINTSADILQKEKQKWLLFFLQQLPITKELIRWEKILSYKVGNELQAKDNKS